MAHEINMSELKGIFRRRKNLFFISSFLIFFLMLVVAFALPSIYESQAMIIVENQEIPQEYVRSTTTTYLGQRLEVLERRILSYGRLLEIVQTHDIYPELASKSEMVTRLQEGITFETIDVSIQDRRSSATIAFTLAFQHRDPQKAKQVCDILSNLFVEEDQISREKQASNTTLFLERELEDLRREVKKNEEKISRFKAANIEQLPGSTSVFQQTVFRLEGEIDDIDTRTRSLQEKIVYLKSQIANIDPLVPILTENGQVANNPNNRLKYLRLQLVQMQSKFSAKHPDIIRLKSEIAELEAQVGKTDTSKEKKDRLKVIEKQIVEMKAKYGDKHPDVVKLTREASLLRRQIAQNTSSTMAEDGLDERSDNPQYLNIKAQIIVSESEMKALRDERAKLNLKKDDYQRRLEMAPFIDEEYNSMTLDYQNAKKKYDEVSGKLHNAKIAQELDTSESGERFRIEYPASLPHKPIKPKRLMIILMGVVLGLGGGLLLAALAEGLDSSVKASEDLESIAGVPVLAAVSFVDSPLQRRLRQGKRMMVVASVLAIILVASLMINWFVMPIGDLWTKFEDRLVEIGVPIDKESKKI